MVGQGYENVRLLTHGKFVPPFDIDRMLVHEGADNEQCWIIDTVGGR